ncbi:hypothetical protein VTI28DRAFT_5003 [Corynascus sepedonium]
MILAVGGLLANFELWSPQKKPTVTVARFCTVNCTETKGHSCLKYRLRALALPKSLKFRFFCSFGLGELARLVLFSKAPQCNTNTENCNDRKLRCASVNKVRHSDIPSCVLYGVRQHLQETERLPLLAFVRFEVHSAAMKCTVLGRQRTSRLSPQPSAPFAAQ